MSTKSVAAAVTVLEIERGNLRGQIYDYQDRPDSLALVKRNLAEIDEALRILGDAGPATSAEPVTDADLGELPVGTELLDSEGDRWVLRDGGWACFHGQVEIGGTDPARYAPLSIITREASR